MKTRGKFFKVSVLFVGGGTFLMLWAIFNLFYAKPDVPVSVSKSDYSVSGGGMTKTALMGNGCFWCAEADFEKLAGVLDIVSGYAGGLGDNPTYENYAENGYREVVEISYDSARVSFAQLVEYLIKHGDPTDGSGSFYDRGVEYAPAVYFENEEEKNIANAVIADIEAKHIYDKPIALPVILSAKFWPAEDYHQDYYKKNPVRYAYYRNRSGRDAFIKKYWGEDVGVSGKVPVSTTSNTATSWKSYVKSSPEVLRTLLTPLQYEVTQEGGTETPFKNEYDTNKRDGIYVDILSGEPLFSSIDKFDSGTGWPSFVKPIAEGSVVLKEDRTLFSVRTEVRSRYADSHLGHVFDDGPKERGGLRYCMNSAALRFVPKDKLVEDGYGEYLALFK